MDMKNFVSNAYKQGSSTYTQNTVPHIHQTYYNQANGKAQAFAKYVESTGQKVSDAATSWNRDKGTPVLGSKWAATGK